MRTALAFLISLTAPAALAHGVAPSACPNGAGSEVVSFVLTVDGASYDLLADPSVEIEATVGVGYDVTMTLADAEGDAIWYRTDAYGFGLGSCTRGGEPEQTLTLRGVAMGQAHAGMVQDVTWGTWPETARVRYRVRWK